MTASFYSSEPLLVRSPAVLFIEPVLPGTAMRLAYDHVNATPDTLTLALVILNDQAEPASISFWGGHAGPDADIVAVGHAATADFVRARLSGAKRSQDLTAGTRIPLIARGFGPNQNLCGIYHIENESSGRIRVAVLACPVGVSPSDAVGTLPLAQRELTLAPQVAADAETVRPVDVQAAAAQDLPPFPPAYGAITEYRVRLTNAEARAVSVDVVLTTTSFATATVAVNGMLYEVARTPPGTRVVVTKLDVPPGSASGDAFVVTLLLAADLNSPAPPVVGFAPAGVVKSGAAADALVAPSESTASSERSIAAEVGSRPPKIPSRIAEPLATALLSEAESLTPHQYAVILEIDPRSRMTQALAFAALRWMMARAEFDPAALEERDPTHGYIFATATAKEIFALLNEDELLARASRLPRIVQRLWADHVVTAQLVDSVPTVKANAAHTSFAALGAGIVWGVIDSGVERHPHFEQYENLVLPDGLSHRDYRGGKTVDLAINALVDEFGHGTHVAGIIAGAWNGTAPPLAATRSRDAASRAVSYVSSPVDGPLTGVAPRCKIVSMRVLDENGTGNASGVIAALEDVLVINDYGRNIRIHGVNLSVGYSFNADWEACGATPICAAVNRLVASGVVVVAAAGNSGDAVASSAHGGMRQTGLAISINDPGNAERAITVGSCYSKAPHTLGIAPSSSKGPTSDGRPKPDLVAPGERVLSCAAQSKVALVGGAQKVQYIEDSGTSMAAPHISGAAAAYLSARREFIGRPDDVKTLMTASATDLKRDRSFQGAGLLDLFRMLVNS